MKDNEEEKNTPVPSVDNRKLAPSEQAELAERLQAKWMRRMEFLLDSNLISPTEMSTLARVLMSNGWQFDMARIPKKLGDKLTSLVDPAEMDEEDGRGILPFQRKADTG